MGRALMEALMGDTVMTGFIEGIGTVRACMDCQVLVAGGPTRCVDCAEEAQVCDVCGVNVVPDGHARCATCVKQGHTDGPKMEEWRYYFSVTALDLIQTSREYADKNAHGLPGHTLMRIVAQMATLLEEAQKQGVLYEPKWRHADHT